MCIQYTYCAINAIKFYLHQYSPNRRSSFCQKVSGASSAASFAAASAFSIAAVFMTNCTEYGGHRRASDRRIHEQGRARPGKSGRISIVDSERLLAERSVWSTSEKSGFARELRLATRAIRENIAKTALYLRIQCCFFEVIYR